MRSVSPRVRRGGALLLLLVALAVPSAYATDGFPEPPEARGKPPVGVTSTSEADEPGFFAWLLGWLMELQARGQPPIG